MSVTLTIPVAYGSKQRFEPRMTSIEYGEGYVQEAPDGINAIVEEWDVDIPVSTTAVIDAIVATLASAASTRIDWTPPGGSAKLWRLPKKWERTFHSYNCESLSFTLRESF